MGLFDSIGQAVGSVMGGLGSGAQQQGHVDGYNPDANNFKLGDTNRQSFASAISNAQNNPGQQDQFRQQQMGLTNYYQNMMNGNQPSVAQMQMQQGQDRNFGQAIAQAASSRGINPALAQRQAQQNIAQGGQQAAMQGAQLRAQEQATGANNFGQMLAQSRLQDIQDQQQRNGMVQYYMTLGFSMDEAQLRANQALEQMKSGISQNTNAINSDIDKRNQDARSAFADSIIKMGSQTGAWASGLGNSGAAGGGATGGASAGDAMSGAAMLA